jgi:hypothetical protein
MQVTKNMNEKYMQKNVKWIEPYIRNKEKVNKKVTCLGKGHSHIEEGDGELGVHCTPVTFLIGHITKTTKKNK